MKVFNYLIVAFLVLALPACEQKLNDNQSGGVKDAIGARPYEGIRDSAEDAGDAVKEAGQNAIESVDGS